jgi:hypothetical protein
MKECKQIPTAQSQSDFGVPTTPHENKNLTNKPNFEEKIFWLILGNDNKPLSSSYHKNKNIRRVRYQSP